VGQARERRERGIGTPDRRAKLTPVEVQAIRRRYHDGGVTQRMLAALYGVSPVTICAVVRGRTWRTA
jgi:DNA-binding transcriptional regulator YiaG